MLRKSRRIKITGCGKLVENLPKNIKYKQYICAAGDVGRFCCIKKATSTKYHACGLKNYFSGFIPIQNVLRLAGLFWIESRASPKRWKWTTSRSRRYAMTRFTSGSSESRKMLSYVVLAFCSAAIAKEQHKFKLTAEQAAAQKPKNADMTPFAASFCCHQTVKNVKIKRS